MMMEAGDDYSSYYEEQDGHDRRHSSSSLLRVSSHMASKKLPPILRDMEKLKVTSSSFKPQLTDQGKE